MEEVKCEILSSAFQLSKLLELLGVQHIIPGMTVQRLFQSLLVKGVPGESKPMQFFQKQTQ